MPKLKGQTKLKAQMTSKFKNQGQEIKMTGQNGEIRETRSSNAELPGLSGADKSPNNHKCQSPNAKQSSKAK
jgi:hypothetical protein